MKYLNKILSEKVLFRRNVYIPTESAKPRTYCSVGINYNFLLKQIFFYKYIILALYCHNLKHRSILSTKTEHFQILDQFFFPSRCIVFLFLRCKYSQIRNKQAESDQNNKKTSEHVENFQIIRYVEFFECCKILFIFTDIR